MKAAKLISWRNIQKMYPDEWVVLSNVLVDDTFQIKKAEVLANTKTRDEAHKIILTSKKPVNACKYTGDILPHNVVVML